MVAYPKEKMRVYQKQHYLKNKPVYIERARLNKIKKKTEQRALISAYKKDHPCVDCGESDPVVLDLDHRDRATKKFNISDCTSKAKWGTKSLLAEIEKCDVRCANCHRRKTHKERNSIPVSRPDRSKGMAESRPGINR